jgi:ABC-type transport system involved in cytochrome bd biosynthesis fused ATPase/permease subunit
MNVVKYRKVKISLERIVGFLGEPEIGKRTDEMNGNGSGHHYHHSNSEASTGVYSSSKEMVGIENGNFLWAEPTLHLSAQAVSTTSSTDSSENSGPLHQQIKDRFRLRDINVQFPLGRLSIVTGPTASGKTALLRALLGEMYTIPPPTLSPTGLNSGLESESQTRIYLPRRPEVSNQPRSKENISYVSYAAQTSWLEHLSIKENILFGNPYDESRYNSVVECCALKPDLDVLDDGDDTEIGERGVSLSGGQKAR